MSMIKTALFDFDGVVADTEPLYDIFWNGIAEQYGIGIPNFAARIKGTTLQRIFGLYFSDYPRAEHEKIAQACEAFEMQMDFPEVTGSVDFLRQLKRDGYRLGLVTSSLAVKMKMALRKMQLESVFDILVTADRITAGKPDPMCYLLAAADLRTDPGDCVVFEDSLSGIQAATAAGMRVIGVATTLLVDVIQEKVSAVIPDFGQPAKIRKLLV